MSDRNLTTTRKQVFGDVNCGTKCRVCGRDVDDGRAKTCSDYCSNLVSAVMGMLNWSSLRRRVVERDDETCQCCGFDMARESRARDHIHDRIEELCGETTKAPSLRKPGEMDEYDWEYYEREYEAYQECRERMKARYGDPYEKSRSLEVDHITPIADGGHPFDPGNLQTLCSECHQDKTSQENSDRADTPSRGEMSQSLFEYVADGGSQN